MEMVKADNIALYNGDCIEVVKKVIGVLPKDSIFPLKLIRSLIASSCPMEGVVYDPFMGSGTTAVATIEVGGDRQFIGSEISPKYIEYAHKRIDIAQAESLTLF